MSKVSEYDNNRVRLDDTAGITTDDLMRLEMHKTFYRLFTYSIFFITFFNFTQILKGYYS